ncbi:hypothetical protein ACHAPT_011219 [Fusarium lateritium]
MTAYTFQVSIDETLFRQGFADSLVLVSTVNGSTNTVFAGFSFNSRGNFEPLFPTWTEQYRITLVIPPSDGEPYMRSGLAEKRAPGFFPSPDSFGVKNVPDYLNASILMYTGENGSWSTVYVDQSRPDGSVAIFQPQEVSEEPFT